MDKLIDEWIQYGIEDTVYDDPKEQIKSLYLTKCILRDELLTCYEFLKIKGFVDDYIAYRGF